MRKAKTVFSEGMSAPSEDESVDDSIMELRGECGKEDSAATELGVPPLPRSEEALGRKHSALVREHISRRQRYVPGRHRSEFFRDPAGGLRCSGPARPPVPPPGAAPRVDRYHYNHYGWRQPEGPAPTQPLPPPCCCAHHPSTEPLPGLYTTRANPNQRFVFRAVEAGPEKSLSVAGHVHKTDLLKEGEPLPGQRLPHLDPSPHPLYQPFDSRPDRIDIYLFDHQDPRYLQTTDNPPPVKTEAAAFVAEDVAVRVWAEVYGVLHFPVAVVTALVVQTVKFVMAAVVRPLVTGLLQTVADYLLKPLLTVLFNGYLQPVLIFLYNLATSFRDLCRPVAAGLGYFVAEVAALIAAFRLVEVRTRTSNGPFFAPPRRYITNV